MLFHNLSGYDPEKHRLYHYLPNRLELAPRFPVSFSKYFLGSFVYGLFNGRELVYIGYSTQIRARFYNHKSTGKEFDSFAAIAVKEDFEPLYIRIYKPKGNAYLKKG